MPCFSAIVTVPFGEADFFFFFPLLKVRSFWSFAADALMPTAEAASLMTFTLAAKKSI